MKLTLILANQNPQIWEISFYKNQLVDDSALRPLLTNYLIIRTYFWSPLLH